MHKLSSLTVVMIAILFSTALPANAKKNADLDDLESPLTVLYDCSAITDSTERLACYDKIVASLQQAEEKKEIVAIDAQSAKKLKKEAFGFNLPSLPKLGLPSFGGDDDGEETLEIAIKSVRKGGKGYVFTMENGQVWRETGGRLNYIPKGDLTATIKPASLGSYKLSVNNGKTTVRGLRVKRVE